jgi:undecaprenyl diphosphate synthase
LPASLLAALAALEQKSREHRDFQVLLCLDYGGGDELVRAVKKLLMSGAREFDEAALRAALDAPDVPPVDLVIRTSGEQRTSGFMPLQAAYAELYFTPVHFPDFDAREFLKALQEYTERQRRFGS